MYVADSGILHALLGLSTREAILSHPEVGASWEGFVVQQIIQLLAASAEQCFHWSTHAVAQLDLLVVAGNRRYGFEVKRAEAPRTTPSMRSALETLGLDRLDVVHAGGRSYAMAPGIRALPAASLAKVLRPLGGVTRLSSPPLAIGCLRLPDLIGSTAPVQPCGPYETSAASALSRVRAVPPSIIRRQESRTAPWLQHPSPSNLRRRGAAHADPSRRTPHVESAAGPARIRILTAERLSCRNAPEY